MRVPDGIRKTVLFVGIDGPNGPEYRGTAYIVAVPGGHGAITTETDGDRTTTIRYPYTFLVTARHVAEKLEGRDFHLRVNKQDGTIAVIRDHAHTRWWYHPTEKKYVDAAVTNFAPMERPELDIEPVPIGMFADEAIIEEHNIGVGDEVFITGLFTKVVETTRNIPIVRTGTVAMIPGEKIPFGKDLIEAYLIESRSIGGLSGSPVFVRETLRMEVFTASGRILDSASKPLPPNQILEIQGTGQFYFFGSVIGHWDLPRSATITESEALNMGISPIVPAHKIREIIQQQEILETMNNDSVEVPE
jgi:hypothetical protein